MVTNHCGNSCRILCLGNAGSKCHGNTHNHGYNMLECQRKQFLPAFGTPSNSSYLVRLVCLISIGV